MGVDGNLANVAQKVARSVEQLTLSQWVPGPAFGGILVAPTDLASPSSR